MIWQKPHNISAGHFIQEVNEIWYQEIPIIKINFVGFENKTAEQGVFKHKILTKNCFLQVDNFRKYSHNSIRISEVLVHNNAVQYIDIKLLHFNNISILNN